MQQEDYIRKVKDLNRYHEAVRIRKRMQGGLEEYKKAKERPKGPAAGCGGTGKKQDLLDYMEKIEEKEDEILLAEIEEENVRKEIEEKIERIQNDLQSDVQNQKDVLHKLYIGGKAIDDIADEMGYGKNNIYKIRKKAIENYKL